MDRFIKLTLAMMLTIGWSAQVVAENYQGLFYSGTPRIQELERKGLETTSTLSFAKDHYGRLWMGGRYGIVWYDGFDYHRIAVDGGHVGGQSPIYKIISAADHGMWYLTHRKTVSFYSFSEKKQYADITINQFQVESIYRLDERELLMATNKGLYSLSYLNNTPTIEKYLSTDESVKFLYIKGGDLYFSTDSSLFKISNFRQQNTDIENIGFQGNISAPFVVDSHNKIWLYSEGSLIRFNSGKTEVSLPNLGVATELIISADEHLWLGTRGKGLWQIDSLSGEVLKEYPIDSLHGVALGADTINAVYEDDGGILWLGRFSTSAAFINPERRAISNIVSNPWQNQQILNNSIFYILKHSSNRLWVAHSRGGISVLNPDGSVYGYITTPSSAATNKKTTSIKNRGREISSKQEEKPYSIQFPVNGSVYALSEDQHGNVYASLGEQGVYQINAELTAIKLLADKQSNSGRKFFNLTFDNHQRLYASGNQGIYVHNHKGFQALDIKGIANFSSRTNHSFVDREDNLWFAGRDYIAVIPNGDTSIAATINAADHKAFSNGSRVRYAYPANSQQALVSIGDQLFSANYRRESGAISLAAITIQKNLSGRLLEDETGKLWSSHETLNLKTGEHRKFGAAEGVLPHIDRYFAQAKLSNNLNIHGSSEGLVLFKPKKIAPWRFDTPTVISNIRFDGQEQTISSDAITFPAQYNSLEIIAAALDYSAPRLNRYAYRIQGVQNQWLESDYHGRRITLANLSPGEYQLELKTSNRSGHWSGQTTTLGIHILPAWYESYWFRALLVLLFLSSLWLLYRLRVRQLTQRQKILAQTVEERTLELNDSLETLKSTQDQLIESEKQASLGRLVRGVSHELNTPIGILKGSNSGLQLLAEETKQAFESGALTPDNLTGLFKNTLSTSELMAKNIERMAQLTSRFKQSLAEEGSATIQEFPLEPLLKAAITEVQDRAIAQGVQINLRCDSTLKIRSYPVVMKNIIEELLNNSLSHGFTESSLSKGDLKNLGEDETKHVEPSSSALNTPEKYTHEIRFTIRKNDSTTELWISDNGQGMDEEHQRKLFDPFFSSSHKTEHIGLGMHSVYNWVNQILHGRIRCRAIPGKGCAIKLELPN